MRSGIEPNQNALLLILAGSVILLFTEWIRIDLTAILILIPLCRIDVLTPDEAMSGFSSKPASLLASTFVLSGALYHTGLSERLGSWICLPADQ